MLNIGNISSSKTICLREHYKLYDKKGVILIISKIKFILFITT